jgi:hypothetical protein
MINPSGIKIGYACHSSVQNVGFPQVKTYESWSQKRLTKGRRGQEMVCSKVKGSEVSSFIPTIAWAVD